MIKFLLRIDGAVYHDLELEAKRTKRSINGLINFIIEEYLRKGKND